MKEIKYCIQCGGRLMPAQMDGQSRLACVDQACGYVHWNNPVPVVAAVVEHRNQVILARNRRWPQGFFSFISGYLEAREEPEAAVVRECREELGLKARVRGWIGNFIFKEKNQIILAYALEADGDVVLGEEIAEYIALPFADMVNYPYKGLVFTETVIKQWLAVRESLK